MPGWEEHAEIIINEANLWLPGAQSYDLIIFLLINFVIKLPDKHQPTPGIPIPAKKNFNSI